MEKHLANTADKEPEQVPHMAAGTGAAETDIAAVVAELEPDTAVADTVAVPDIAVAEPEPAVSAEAPVAAAVHTSDKLAPAEPGIEAAAVAVAAAAADTAAAAVPEPDTAEPALAAQPEQAELAEPVPAVQPELAARPPEPAEPALVPALPPAHHFSLLIETRTDHRTSQNPASAYHTSDKSS